MILLIIACSLIGTVILIGACVPLSTTVIPTTTPRDDPPSTSIVEPYRDDREFNKNREFDVSDESIGEDANNSGSESGESIIEDSIKAGFRKSIASKSVPILRSRGMTDEEIKAELLRDFAITEEQVDEILAAQ